MLKKLNVLIIIALGLTLLSACSAVEISGIENFQKETCSVELTAELYPTDDFLSRFQYEYGSYQYLDKDDWKWGDVRVVSHLQYTSENYDNAKEYCLANFAFCEDHFYEYNGYRFAEILCHTIRDEHDGLIIGCNYPKHFNMFAYNDQQCILVFLGYYNGDPNLEEKQLALNNFESFLESVYSNYFDFST